MTATPIGKLIKPEISEMQRSINNMQDCITEMQKLLKEGNNHLLVMENIMDKNYEQSVKTNILLQEILRKLGGEVWKEL